MPVIPAWGNAIVAVILGGGALWYVLSKLKAADTQKARADTAESFIKGDAAASETEVEIDAAIKKVNDEKENVDPTKWD